MIKLKLNEVTQCYQIDIFGIRVQYARTMNFQIFKLVLEKAEEPEIKLPTSAGSLKKQEFQNNIYFCFID